MGVTVAHVEIVAGLVIGHAVADYARAKQLIAYVVLMLPVVALVAAVILWARRNGL
jgi:flagellar biosynthesis/type III secretory pathway M-ring protein FliF/YscJ